MHKSSRMQAETSTALGRTATTELIYMSECIVFYGLLCRPRCGRTAGKNRRLYHEVPHTRCKDSLLRWCKKRHRVELAVAKPFQDFANQRCVLDTLHQALAVLEKEPRLPGLFFGMVPSILRKRK